MLHVSLAVYAFTIEPIVEESTKFGFLLLFLIPMNRRARSPSENYLSYSAAQMGMLPGSFFMLLERWLKDLPGGFSFPMDILDEVPVHAVTTGILASTIKRGTLTGRVADVFPVAVIVHAGYNLLLVLSVSADVLTALQVLAFVAFWYAFVRLGRHLHPEEKVV